MVLTGKLPFVGDEGRQSRPKFCAKIEGVETIKLGSKVAYYLRFEDPKTEVCHHDKATESVRDAT
jgi:hypothetical protein